MPHTVLLVDDEPSILAGLRRALRKEPYEILCANAVEEALGMLQDRAVDVVVSDQDMPGTVGTTLLTRVRHTYPDIVRFMLTGKGTLDVASQAIEEGAVSDFFVKPCDNRDLAAAIRSALQQHTLLLTARKWLRTAPHHAAELEQWARTYPRIMKVVREERPGSTSTPDTPLLTESLNRLRSEAAPEMLLVVCRRGTLMRATLHAMDETSLLVNCHHSTLFVCAGEEVLVLWHVLPHQRYIVQTRIEEVYLDKLKLRYQG